MRRFSRTLRNGKTSRPSGTWLMPRRIDLVRVHAPDFAAFEYDAALLRVHDAGNGFQHGGLASAVGAEDRDDAALRHVKGHAADGHDQGRNRSRHC